MRRGEERRAVESIVEVWVDAPLAGVEAIGRGIHPENDTACRRANTAAAAIADYLIIKGL